MLAAARAPIFALFIMLICGPNHELLAQEKPEKPEKAASVTCAHHQLCNLASELLTVQDQARLKPLYPDVGSDPHELKIGPELLKSYYEAPYLLLPDPALSPWQELVLKQRSPENTFVAMVQTQSITGTYPGAMAHFWLYPEELCQLRQNLAQQLSAWGLEVRNSARTCSPARTLILRKRLAQALSKQSYILTHDALAPLFESLNADFMVIKSAGHSHEIAPTVFKEIHQRLQKNKRVIWLIETEIGLPPQLRELIRPGDGQLRIKVTGRANESVFRPLENLARGLERVAQNE